MEEPKPYWPGLEIEEQDKTKASGGMNTNNDANGKGNEVETNTNMSAKEDLKKGEKRIVSIGREEEGSSAINANETGKANTTRSTGDVSRFRSRKRRRKLHSSDNLSKLSESNDIAIDGEKGQSDPAKSTTNVAISSTIVATSNEANKKYAEPVGKASVLQHTVTTTEESSNNSTAAKAPNETAKGYATSPGKGANGKTDDQSSVSSSEIRSTVAATPRTLVNFLVQRKIPILDKVVSDIREVLFGMVSRSPSLLQKYLEEASQSSFASNSVGVHTQVGNNNSSVLESERKKSPKEDDKFDAICKQQELLMDRIGEMELAATKREKEFSAQIQEQNQLLQQQNDEWQFQRQQQDWIEKLQSDYKLLEEANVKLNEKLERRNRTIETYRLELEEKDRTIVGLKQSKRLMKHSFQSCIEEQLGVIEKHRQSLEIERRENEKLRKRILLLEGEEDNRSVESVTAENESVDDETATKTSIVVLGEASQSTGKGRDEHAAYRHRVRQRHANGQQQKDAYSLQSTTSSSRSVLENSGITRPSSSSRAFSPRVRRN